MNEPVDPDHLEQVEFSVVRRGLDPDAVRSTLAEAADGLRLLKRQCHELEHRVEALEEQVPEPDVLQRDRDAAQAEGREAGEAEGEQQRIEAMSEAEVIVAEAKEEGRGLIGEAQIVRRRMLEDLARRRRALRQQIEQLRGGRERLLEAYEVVGHTLREATSELSSAMPEARAAAERAGHGVGPEETVEQLEAEIESARMAGLPIVAEQEYEAVEVVDRPRPVAVPLERDVRDMPEVEPLLADFEEVRLLSGDTGTELVDPDEPEPEPVVADAVPIGDHDAEADQAEDDPDDLDPNSAGVSDGDPAGDDAGCDLADADGSDGEADLFARLRHSQSDGEDPVPTGTVTEGPRNRGTPPERPGGSDAIGADPEPDRGGAEDPAMDDAPAPLAGDSEASAPAGSQDDDDLDRTGDEGEPFGLVLGAEPDAVQALDERATAEKDLARRLKRLLSDEQNDVLDRLRRTRKRTLTTDDLLDDLDERVTRFADVVAPILATVSGGADLESPVDDLAAELAREVAESLVDGLVEHLEEEISPDELSGCVRALYRQWKTGRIVTVAERYVEAADPAT